MRDTVGIVAQELCSLPNVTVIVGSLADPKVINELFSVPAELAFINTTHWDDEIAIGKQLANAAQRTGVQHLIYSSMPDHSSFGRGWQALPLWSNKSHVENYIKSLSIPSTFIYCGIYHNNFTSLPYPLFRMELQEDGSFHWQAPFHPQKPLPWIDAEHDVGPVVLQIFKDGPAQWGGKRYVSGVVFTRLSKSCLIRSSIPLAFEYLTPLQVCSAFSKALQRPVQYVRGPIEIRISIPAGYQEQLFALQHVLGAQEAPYFGPDLEPNCTNIAQHLWEGNRSIEEYAREVFPVEESNNGLTWMDEGDEPNREIELDFTSLTF
jgi:NmrA-like family protein